MYALPVDARALVLAAILCSSGAARADAPPPPPDPGAPGADRRVSPEDEAYCEHRCRTRAGCGSDERCRVYLEREAERREGGR